MTATIVAKAGRPQKSIIVEIATTGGTAIDKRFEAQVSSCDITPSSSQITWQGGVPAAKLSDSSPTTWVANITAIQAWDDANSFVNLCFANQGLAAVLTYFPHDDTAVGFKVNITLPAPKIGGGVGAYNESSFAIPCDAPVKVTTLPA
jgi:hypothetical protein